MRTKPLPQQVSGGIPGFKWRRWSNGSKNQNPQNPLDQKLTPPPPKLLDKLRTTKIIQLKSSKLRKYLPDFSFSKRITELKILNPTNPFFIAVTWNPEYLHWSFVPQISWSKVLLMTYFITAKQIVEYEAESQRPTSKKETTTNGKRTKYLLFFGNRNTLNTKTKNPHLRWKGLLQSTKMGQLNWSVTIPFRHLRCL